MDVFDILLQAGLLTAAVVFYLIFFKRSSPLKFKGNYRQPGWNYALRLLLARLAVKRWKALLKPEDVPESPRSEQKDGWDAINIRASAPDGTAVLLTVRKLCKQSLAEAVVYIKLPDGTSYRLPQHPDTTIGPFESIDRGWSAGGLKIQVLEEKERLRILFNGLLKRDLDDVVQYCRFSFIWASATSVLRHPEDWSNELAAQALSLEPWRDGKWPHTLEKRSDSNWLQWGTIQGRFTSYVDGCVDTTEYLRMRGVRERSWSPLGYRGLLKSVVITAAARDGTAVQLRGFSYKEVLTIGFCGSVRLPNYKVQSLTDTDLVLSEFCEVPDGIPKIHAFNVSSGSRDFNIVLHINSDGGKLLSGYPYQHELVYRTASVSINGEHGTAILECGYETSAKSAAQIDLSPKRLRWFSAKEAGEVGYCIPLEARAAACTDYVGGKGASLALLATVQEELGYRVPPGFCITTKCLEKQLQVNPIIKTAIDAIAAASEGYEENKFKEKCNKAVDLFMKTEIVKDVQEAILAHLKELRRKAMEQNFGPELHFAVRSSAVGEDSEALSAAGQNETILGCATDADVIAGVMKCWGSMFAFTSAHYRRQNGQPCLCGGAVVVQVLVPARAAGVMFTRHPELGDPTRLLITANYGLGETVVSGSVEPDTIIVGRNIKDEISILKIDLGSKISRVTASSDGVSSVEVPENKRKLPCLTVTEILRLSKIGVMQDKLWGAGRDIEWAVVQDEIFLLQARPITSLDRWSEEELLHESDFPIMADDELITFANTGEVLPKPLSAMSQDLVYESLSRGMESIIYGTQAQGYDRSICITHNRASMPLYNTIYKIVPEKINMAIRILEISIHGHKVADDNIIATARHRNVPTLWERFNVNLNTFKYLLATKTKLEDTIKIVKKMNLENIKTDNPLEMLEAIYNGHYDTLCRCTANHGTTTTGNIVTQLIAMSILVEGASDFTIEQCNEINVLLSSGSGTVSAEVPQALASLTRKLEDSGKADEFRRQKPKDAMHWLKHNLPEVHEYVCKFLENHGHRAIMEFDLATKPWALVPEELMEVLQNMRLPKQETQVTKTTAEIIASLKTPKKSSTRRILRWVLPLCHRTVRHRETTKDYLILAIHKVRLALRRLARLLVKQWYLPDEELVFHFRLHELKEFILTRDPALLRKAIQRQQYYPAWCKLKFAEMNTGWPQPLQSNKPAVTSGDVRLKATSVCGGEVIARACVINDLSEIHQLQHGDVLITHSTDIGWSPYFPLLSGIVTELGGLISHGAVIAREYGLPCIVGAADATDIFTTGDTVCLSGDQGFIEKVLLHQQDESETQTVNKQE